MIGPQQLIRDLGGRWYHSRGSAACPCCQPEKRRSQNALSIGESGGRLLLHCHKSGCAFRDILVAAGVDAAHHSELDHQALAAARLERLGAVIKSRQKARSLWERGQPIAGTHGETYMRSRGISCALPEALRWIPDIFHGPSGQKCSAIVANVVSAEGGEMGIHRTFTKQGKRLKQHAKMMLGRCAGGAVRLSGGNRTLAVCEGIETGLSLASGLLDQPASVWATLSSSGMRGLVLPDGPHKLIIATDGDEAGRSAGDALALRAHKNGWDVHLLPAPEGKDWNDVLCATKPTEPTEPETGQVRSVVSVMSEGVHA